MMMTLSQYAMLLIAGYAVVVLSAALWSYRAQSHNGYIIGNRELGWFTTSCSLLAGQFNGGGVFLLFTLALMLGYGLMWFSFGFLAGYIVLALLSRKVHAEGRQYDDINIPDIITRRVGPKTGSFASFVVIGKALLFGTAQLLIAGTVIAAMIDVSNAVGISITALFIGLYVWMGGYMTVAKTDVLQWGIMLAIAIGMACCAPLPSFSVVMKDMVQAPDTMVWGLTLFSFTMIISNADPWQRIQSAKSAGIAQKSLMTSSLVFIVFVFLWIMTVKGSGLVFESNTAFFLLFHNQQISPFVLSILGVFTLIAVMSTIDTQVQLFTSALAKNVLALDLEKERSKFVVVSRGVTAGLLAIMALAASLVGGSMEFILKAFSFAYILAPVLIIAMLWSPQQSAYKDITCVLSLCAGLAVYAYMFFGGYFQHMINNVIPAGVTLGVCCLFIFVDIFFKIQRVQSVPQPDAPG